MLVFHPRGRRIALVFSLVLSLAALAAGCFDSDTVECAGVVCPAGASCTADGKWCTSDACGNGSRDSGEECDDGNLDPADNCTDECKTAVCGDGKTDEQDPGVEACDNRRTDPTMPVDTTDCDGDCTLPACGDGYHNAARETCDNQRTDPNVPVDTYGCDGDCTANECGDDYTNQSVDPARPVDERCKDDLATGTGCPEVCDDGGTARGDECSANCLSDYRCGNGILDRTARVPEVCDDGNDTDQGSCSATCLSGLACGNGIVDPSAGELCDDLNEGQGTPDVNNEDNCLKDCFINICGDGWIDRADPRVEACDGNGAGTGGETAGCDRDCSQVECGDGTANQLAGERCDEAGEGPTSAVENNRDDCLTSCLPNTCGDGWRDVVGARTEGCDGDDAGHGGETGACDTDCTPRVCGDGTINHTSGEQCDEQGEGTGTSDDNNDDDCLTDCRLNVCGDGWRDQEGADTEGCDGDDDGTPGETAGCDLDCTPRMCGDRVVNRTAGEQCDDGNTDNGDNCRNDCTINICGDGFRDRQDPRREECDGDNAGHGGETDACDLDCTDADCGDGTLNVTADELCDDDDSGGTADNRDNCVNTCVPNVCGDGWRDLVAPRIEACDGQDNGTPGETATCDLDCTAVTCGDGTINHHADEECDELGEGTGTPVANNRDDCLTTCQRNVCGDGWRDTVGPRTEACDGDDSGHPGEVAGCDDDCTAPECGDGNVNFGFDDPDDPAGPEQCDDGNTSDNDFCLNDCQVARCGDGERWEIPGPTPDPEACDDGNTSSTDDCRNDCQPNICGDGIRQLTGASTEECDDGNRTDSHNGCDGDCERNDDCGNHRVESLFEQCDDGDDDDTGNGCSDTCQQNNTCGNNIVEDLFEECDLGGDNGDPGECCTAICTRAPGHQTCP